MTLPEGDWLTDTRTSYDTVAAGYADFVTGILDDAPFVRAALTLFADQIRPGGGGPVADIGCGPGHITAHLQKLGVDAFGIDLSPGMIDVARRDHPDLRFDVGSMTDLSLAGESIAGLLAFWSLIHIPDEALATVFGEFRRVLRPGGLLMAGFHVGTETRHKTQGYGGLPMNVHIHYRRLDEVAAGLGDAGFTVTAHLLFDIDQNTPGAVIFARRRP